MATRVKQAYMSNILTSDMIAYFLLRTKRRANRYSIFEKTFGNQFKITHA